MILCKSPWGRNHLIQTDIGAGRCPFLHSNEAVQDILSWVYRRTRILRGTTGVYLTQNQPPMGWLSNNRILQKRWKQTPKGHPINFAERLIFVPAKSLEIGHFSFAVWAYCANLSASRPGTSASQFRSMLITLGPSSSPKWTEADVFTLVGGNLSALKMAARYIEKHPEFALTAVEVLRVVRWVGAPLICEAKYGCSGCAGNSWYRLISLLRPTKLTNGVALSISLSSRWLDGRPSGSLPRLFYGDLEEQKYRKTSKF